MDYLLVSNKTLGDEIVLEIMRQTARRRQATFHLLVPVSPHDPHDSSAAGETGIAQDRLVKALKRFRSEGLSVTGEVAVANPMHAIESAFATTTFDRVIIVTLPHGKSRWIHQDLPHRVSRKFEISVEWLTTQDDPRDPASMALIRSYAAESRTPIGRADFGREAEAFDLR